MTREVLRKPSCIPRSRLGVFRYAKGGNVVNFTMHILEYELRDLIAGKSINSDYRRGLIEYPMIFKSFDDYYENIVYVACAEHLIEALEELGELSLTKRLNKMFFCICVGKPPDFIIENEYCDIIWTESSSVRRSDLFNRIQDIFQHYNNWERKLEGIVSSFGDVTALVNTSLSIIKNDIWLNDQYNKVLAHRIYHNVRYTQKQLEEIQENEYLPKHMIDDGIMEAERGRDFTALEPIFYKMQSHNCTTISCAIHITENYRLNLVIEPNYQEVGEKDYIPLLILARCVKLAYSRLNITSDLTYDVDPRFFLKSLIQGENISSSDLSQCLLALGWESPGDRYLCLCLDFSFDYPTHESYFIRPYMWTCSRIQQIYHCFAFTYENCVVCIVNLTELNMGSREFFKRLEPFACENNLVVGSSNPFTQVRELANRYLQARTALNRGKKTKEETVIHPFNEILVDYAVRCIIEEMTPEFFCPQELLALIKYDREHGSALYNTLKVFLTNNCSVTKACKELFLQRNSLNYRLEKIKKMMGYDLNDPEKRLLLLLSLRIIDAYGIKNLSLEHIDFREP